jgi:integrase
LRWADIENDTIHLRGEDSKNREPRSIPVTGELIQVIERRRRARAFETPEGEQLSEWIFHREGNGNRIAEFRKAWASACKRAGCPGKLFHDLRRTAVRDLVRSGVPQSVAMDISGHKTISMFKRYNITDQRDKVAAFQHLAEHHEKARKKVVTMVGVGAFEE